MLAQHAAITARPASSIARTRPDRAEFVEVGRRSWDAIAVQVQQLDNCPRLSRPFKASTPTLLVVLEEVGGSAEIRLHPDRSSRPTYRGRNPISFVPAGIGVWVDIRDVRYLRQVVISFGDGNALGSDPRLMFADRRMSELVSLLAREVLSETPLDAAYGDGLGAAISTSLCAAAKGDGTQSGLAPWQLKRVTDHMRANMFARIHLIDMAELVGLSQSHFSRAFKVSTGVSPHRFLLDFRVTESKRLLLDTSLSLAEIALAIGFCEQAHFTRAFGAATGTTPAAWRKSLKQLGRSARSNARGSAISA